MGTRRCISLTAGRALAASLCIAALAGAGAVRAETPPAGETLAAEPTDIDSSPLLRPSLPAADPNLACPRAGQTLGVSRVVEIDTASGPEFGDQYAKTETKFLEDGEVVLTFDDGPMRRYTLPILDALDEHCIKATFFAVGRMAIADPATLQDVIRRGHTVGTHTWSHKQLSKLGASAMQREVELGVSAVAAAAGTPISPFFRFPYLGHSHASRTYIQGRGMGIVGIHVDSRDFRTRSPGVVLRNVLSQLERERKGILLFHDIQPSTAGAIGNLIEDLKERGYKFVHIVPKSPVVTLPEYDAIAAKMLQSKSVAAVNALATRAATWPVSDGAAEPASRSEPAAETARRPAVAAPEPAAAKPTTPFDWANPSNDPWQLKSFGNP